MTDKHEQIHLIYQEYESIRSSLSEKERRLWAAQKSKNLGYGGITLVCQATGISKATIYKGIKDLQGSLSHSNRIRRPGGGRKKMEEKIHHIEEYLITLMKPQYQPHPATPFLWTHHNVNELSRRLGIAGIKIGADKVADFLRQSHFFLRPSSFFPRYPTTKDRNAQCKRIWMMAEKGINEQQPLVYLDILEAEEPFHALLAEMPTSHGLLPCHLGDITREKGWKSLGFQDHHTDFALQSLRTWWQDVGRSSYPGALKLYLVVRGYPSQPSQQDESPWLQGLQYITDKYGVSIRVRHLPPCTFRWNHILQKTTTYGLFEDKILATNLCVIGLSQNPTLTSAFWDTRHPPTLLPTSTFNIKRDKFHPGWNYVVTPL